MKFKDLTLFLQALPLSSVTQIVTPRCHRAESRSVAANAVCDACHRHASTTSAVKLQIYNHNESRHVTKQAALKPKGLI
jgi:hypothetical protein